jgi:acid phosphatase (class A)
MRALQTLLAFTVMAVIVTGADVAAADESARSGDSGKLATSNEAARRKPGFLDAAQRPDSVALVPPPPAAGSAAEAADVAVHRAQAALRDTPRWRLAAADADVSFPHAAGVFACALGIPITERETPNLYELLQRVMVDAGQSTSAAKSKYRRPRPYVVYDDPICVPEHTQVLRDNAAYPSGHAAAGWAWALVLAELAPDRLTDVLRRGLEFGQSRVVCGVHWQSDVETGRTVAAAVVARLHAEPEFTAQMTRARAEIAQQREVRAKPAMDCAAEAATLYQVVQPPSTE